MKKSIIILLLAMISMSAQSQLIGNLSVSPQPPGAILSWGTKDLAYMVSNQGQATRRAVIKSVLTLVDGTPVATANLAKANVYNITPGSFVFTAIDVLPLEALVFVGKFKNSMDRSGKLPAGSYQLCVQLVTPIDFVTLTEVRCRTFTIASYQLPIPVMPASEDVLNADRAQTSITFRWTPVTPSPQIAIRCIVTVFEILDRQTPMQALRSNQPLLTKDIIGTTQYIWIPQLSFIKTKIWDNDSSRNVPQRLSTEDRVLKQLVEDSISVSKFIWTIQTTDLQGNPFGDGNVNGDGISEPNMFIVVKDRRRNPAGPPATVLYRQYLDLQKQ